MLQVEKVATALRDVLARDFGIAVDGPVSIVERPKASYFTLPIVSPDLGVFAGIIKTVTVSVRYELGDDGNTWALVSLSYEHHGGGRNGHTLTTVWLDKKAKVIDYRHERDR